METYLIIYLIGAIVSGVLSLRIYSHDSGVVTIGDIGRFVFWGLCSWIGVVSIFLFLMVDNANKVIWRWK